MASSSNYKTCAVSSLRAVTDYSMCSKAPKGMTKTSALKRNGEAEQADGGL